MVVCRSQQIDAVFEFKDMLVNMKNTLFGTLTFASLLLSISTATAGHAQTRSPAELAFQKLQLLAGEWEGKDERGKVVRTVFQPSISRTVIMEMLSPSGMIRPGTVTFPSDPRRIVSTRSSA